MAAPTLIDKIDGLFNELAYGTLERETTIKELFPGHRDLLSLGERGQEALLTYLQYQVKQVEDALAEEHF